MLVFLHCHITILPPEETHIDIRILYLPERGLHHISWSCTRGLEYPGVDSLIPQCGGDNIPHITEL